jgi:hypothetical protein
VNLPLLHRLGAGIAKVKVAGKEYCSVHLTVRKKGQNDYSIDFLQFGKPVAFCIFRAGNGMVAHFRHFASPTTPIRGRLDPDQPSRGIECKTPVSSPLSDVRPSKNPQYVRME